MIFEHFWKIVVLIVIVLWVTGKLPMPSAMEIIDFLKEMKQ